MKIIIALLQHIKTSIPVEWDRYTDGNGFYNIYGWISRSDGQRDFLLLQFQDDLKDINFVTSSAKYSKQICDLLYGEFNIHVPCKKIEELTNME